MKLKTPENYRAVYTAFNWPEQRPSVPGKRLKNTYAIRLNERGEKELYVSGKTNVYEHIQASAASVDINNIIARFEAGDLTAINQRRGQYFDATGMPTTLAEAQNLIMQMESDFMKLPLKLREKFHNSATEYIAEYGSAGFMEKLAPFMPHEQPIGDAASQKKPQSDNKEE